jgi:O-antigen/teichoic acid export membrane protein
MISHLADREGQAAGSGGVNALQHVRLLWIIALVGVVTLAAVWPGLVEIVFGTGYRLAREEGQLALIPFIPTLTGTALTAALLAGGHSLPLLGVGAVQATIQFSLAWLLIPRWGLPGFFAAQAISAAAAVVLWLVALGRKTHRPPFRAWMVPLLALSLGLCGILVLDIVVDETIIQRSILAAAAGVVTLAVIVFGAFTGSERIRLAAGTERIATAVWARLARAVGRHV